MRRATAGRSSGKWMKNVQILNDLLKFESNRKLKQTTQSGCLKFMAFVMQGNKHTVQSSSHAEEIHTAPGIKGCLLLVRIFSTTIKALKFANIEECKKGFWIESRTFLSWIRNSPGKFKPFNLCQQEWRRSKKQLTSLDAFP